MKKHLKLAMPVVLASLTNVYGGTTVQQKEQSQMPPRYAKSEAQSPSSSAVFLCSPAYTFDMYFSALILQPTGSSHYYSAEADPLPAPTPNWKIRDVQADYDFGFDVGIGGIFHGANSSLNLDWERFHNDDSSHKTVDSDDMIGPFFEIGPDALPYKEAHGRVNFHFDQVNLDYGQFVNFGKRLQTNFFAGVGFVRIKQTLNTKYSSLDEDVVRRIKTPSKFTGAGPQFGIDFIYCIVEGFQFVGQTRASLFVGTLKNRTTFKSDSPLLAGLGIDPPNTQHTKVNDRTQVVPGFEGQLGFAYAYNFCRHYMVKLEAGYQAQIYLNAVQNVELASQVIDLPVPDETVGVYARTFQRTLSNFALAGPYVKIEFGF